MARTGGRIAGVCSNRSEGLAFQKLSDRRNQRNSIAQSLASAVAGSSVTIDELQLGLWDLRSVGVRLDL